MDHVVTYKNDIYTNINQNLNHKHIHHLELKVTDGLHENSYISKHKSLWSTNTDAITLANILIQIQD